MYTLIEVLKWIGIVLLAGFIGYIGRYLAGLIIDRVHKKKSSPTSETAKETLLDTENRLEESRLKLEKKKAKAEAKKPRKQIKPGIVIVVLSHLQP